MKKRAVWAFEWIGEVFICLIMHGNQNYDNWQKTFIRNSYSRIKRICQNSAKSHKKKRSSQSLPFDLCIDVNLFRVRKSELGSMFYEICTYFMIYKKGYLPNSLNIVEESIGEFSSKWNAFFQSYHLVFVPLRLLNRWTYNYYLLKNPFLLEIFHLDAEQSNLPKWAAPFDSCFCCCCHFMLFHKSNILNQSMKFKTLVASWSWPWFWISFQFLQFC